MPAELLVGLGYALMFFATITVASRAMSEYQDAPFVAITAILWPIFLPILFTVWLAEYAQRYWRR